MRGEGRNKPLMLFMAIAIALLTLSIKIGFHLFVCFLITKKYSSNFFTFFPTKTSLGTILKRCSHLSPRFVVCYVFIPSKSMGKIYPKIGQICISKMPPIKQKQTPIV